MHEYILFRTKTNKSTLKEPLRNPKKEHAYDRSHIQFHRCFLGTQSFCPLTGKVPYNVQSPPLLLVNSASSESLLLSIQ